MDVPVEGDGGDGERPICCSSHSLCVIDRVGDIDPCTTGVCGAGPLDVVTHRRAIHSEHGRNSRMRGDLREQPEDDSGEDEEACAGEHGECRGNEDE